MHICFGHQRWLPGPSKQLYQANSFFYRRTWLMLASISEIVSSSSVMKFCEIIGEDYNCGYVWLQVYYTRLLLPHSFCLTQSLLLTQGRTRSSLQLRFYESLIIYPWSTSQCEKKKKKQTKPSKALHYTNYQQWTDSYLTVCCPESHRGWQWQTQLGKAESFIWYIKCQSSLQEQELLLCKETKTMRL